MTELWIIEVMRAYLKGDRYRPDYVLQPKGGESNEKYEARAKAHADGRNHRELNFRYRATKFKRTA